MAWTKGQLVTAALSELSLSDDQGFEITPEEKQRALKRMDAMVATWAAKGVRIGYAFPAGPDDSDLNTDSGIPDSAAEAVYLNLARRLSPSYGKTLSAETLKNARDGYDTLLWGAAHPIEQQLPHTMPRGSGNKPWRTINRQFMPHPDEDPLRADDGGANLTILPE
jgi:hypothetical protein